ncbi:MAG TPA: hypothetical protein VK358_03260, partial [Longimicrobium sp.]|nr:hypothetical protein [Longimicrobium sp.]
RACLSSGFVIEDPFDFLRERTPKPERAQAFARDRRIYSAQLGAGLLPRSQPLGYAGQILRSAPRIQ